MKKPRVLVVKLSSLGDLFHALPAVHALKTGLGAEIDWVVHEEYSELVRCFDDVDGVIPFPRRAFFTRFGGFIQALRSRRYACIIDLQGLFKSGLVVGLTRGRRRIGPSFYREGARLFYSAVAGPRRRGRHAVEQNCDIVRFLDLPAAEACFPVTFPDAAVNEARPRVAMLPVSRWPTKNWPPRCFVEVARRLQKVRDVSLFLLGGPSDREVCREMEADLEGRVINLAGKLSLPESGGILAEMDLLISNDSGPVHMAVAAGTRTLVMFGPTDPARTGPYGPGHRTVTASYDCAPCFSRVCRRDGIPCLSGITPEHVSELALEMLSER
jgi:lipopolysaccharide heptosyltransferase I